MGAERGEGDREVGTIASARQAKGEDRMIPSFLLKKIRRDKWKENEEHFKQKNLIYDVDEKKDLNYMDDGSDLHNLDLYGPKDSTEALPVVVLIHGGGYISCDKFIDEAQGKYFATQGFRVVNINYSLQPEKDFIGVMQEIFCALRWVEKNAQKYFLDDTQIFVYGESAGGHYAMLAGAIQNNQELGAYYGISPLEKGIRGVAVSCPMYEIHSIREKKDFASRFLRSILLPGGKRKDEAYAEHVSIPTVARKGGFPEIFLLTTPTDTLLYREVRRLHQILETEKIPHRYKEYTSEERKLGHVFHATDPEFPESKAANRDILNFFREKGHPIL